MDGEKENILKRDRKRLSSTYFNQASGKTKCIQKLKCIQKPRYIETESFVIHTRFFEAGFLLFFFGSSLFFRLSSVFPAPVCSSGSRLLFRLPSVLPAPLRSSGSPPFFRLPSVLPTPVPFPGSRPFFRLSSAFAWYWMSQANFAVAVSICPPVLRLCARSFYFSRARFNLFSPHE